MHIYICIHTHTHTYIIEVYLTYNVSIAQQGVSAIHIYIFIFDIIFYHMLLWDTDCISLGYTVNLCFLLHIYFILRNLAFYSCQIKQLESKCHEVFGQKFMFSKIHILYTHTHTHTHTHTRFFYYAWWSLEREHWKRTDGNTGKHKLNDIGPLNMKQKKVKQAR